MSRTHIALLRAEAEHKLKYQKNCDQLDIEPQLRRLNLGKQQLARQNLSELRQSINRINACIQKPLSSLNIDLNEFLQGKEELITAFLPVLLKRKRLVLELIDTKVTDASIIRIRSALKHMGNSHARAKIEKPLAWLQRKNQFLKKEYHSISAAETETSFNAPSECSNSSYSR
ncbi:MAG: hypothetical protein KJO34_02320 [Deltaproteobacteria bacterium]|nr:hypothetical protein [Deltaproteobacteria bacterium]